MSYPDTPKVSIQLRQNTYTIGIVLREAIPNIDARDVKILATDISTRVLAAARRGVYGPEALRDMPPGLPQRHFEREDEELSVRNEVRRLIRFARLNLMEEWPMKGPFQAIFCRNVMIYFDKETQERLVERYRRLLAPGGHLFVGHSESLTGIRHEFAYVKPALYRKK